jgi:hypothetical protein
MYHLFFPIIAIVGYILYPTQLRINPKALYYLSIIHNAVLIAFSSWTVMSLSRVIIHEGIAFESSNYFQNKEFDKIIYYFYLSKYYEFFDTFLLYLNGKSPIFLQKYHHIGAVLCWHLTYVYKMDCIWLPSLLNAFVHSIMYSYYLGCLLKIERVRFIKKYITELQLCQLIAMFMSSNYLYKESGTKQTIIWIVNVYDIGLIFLFGQFYYDNYMEKNRKRIL